MKYKVGDKVRIKSVEGLTATGRYVGDHMLELAGKVATIKEVMGEVTYKLEEDARGYRWSDDMFSGLATQNKMPEVAALLGVEIGEEFDIGGRNFNPYKMTERGIVDCDKNPRREELYRTLTGEWTIIKKPWKPDEDDKYYYVNPNGQTESSRFFHAFDYSMLHVGNCFRTEQEAEAKREAIMEKFGWK